MRGCRLREEVALQRPTGLRRQDSTPKVRGCRLREEVALQRPTGLRRQDSTPKVRGCRLREEVALQRPTGLRRQDSTPKVRGCRLREEVALQRPTRLRRQDSNTRDWTRNNEKEAKTRARDRNLRPPICSGKAPRRRECCAHQRARKPQAPPFWFTSACWLTLSRPSSRIPVATEVPSARRNLSGQPMYTPVNVRSRASGSRSPWSNYCVPTLRLRSWARCA